METASGSAISSYTQWANGTHSRLLFGSYVITSACGVQQGDPAGPALFAITISASLSNARLSFNASVLDLWYGDDRYILGPINDAIHAFEELERNFAIIGLSVNKGKCAIWTRNISANEEYGVPTQTFETSDVPLRVLGFKVVGSQDAFFRIAKEAVHKVASALSPLSKLHQAQGEFAMRANQQTWTFASLSS